MRLEHLTCFALCAMLGPTHVSAHGIGEPASAQAPLFVDGAVAGVGSDYGLILLEDGAPIWVAEEGMPAEPTGWLVVDGAILAATTQGLYRTRDAGCSWRPEDEVTLGATVTELVRDATGVLWASMESGRGGVVVSRAPGASSWEVAREERELLFSGVARLEGSTWVAGFDRGALEEFVDVRADESDGWARIARGERCRIVGSSTSAVFTACGGEDELVIASHAMNQDEELWRSERDVVDLLVDGEAYFERTADDTLRRVSRSGEVLDGISWRALCVARGADGRVWRCMDTNTSLGHVERWADGGWDPEVWWREVRPRACEGGTPGARANATFWPIMLQLGVGGVDEDPEEASEESRGCGVSGGGTQGGGLVRLWLLACVVFAAVMGRARRLRGGDQRSRDP